MMGRLILDSCRDGPWNMAADEALLAFASNRGAVPVLRWYSWHEPTLSLGYFQTWSQRPAELGGVLAVRRITGGGAILHGDRERTYSLILPRDAWPEPDQRALVRRFHRTAADCIGGRLAPDHVHNQADPPFLCFARHGAGDVLQGDIKVLGSAQRLRRGALLQHGSLVLNSESDSAWASSAITARLGILWGWTFELSQMTAEELLLADELARTKYDSTEWTRRR